MSGEAEKKEEEVKVVAPAEVRARPLAGKLRTISSTQHLGQDCKGKKHTRLTRTEEQLGLTVKCARTGARRGQGVQGGQGGQEA